MYVAPCFLGWVCTVDPPEQPFTTAGGDLGHLDDLDHDLCKGGGEGATKLPVEGRNEGNLRKREGHAAFFFWESRFVP